MNLTDIKPTQTALQFANSMQNTFGVTVDISKLDLDKSAKLLISVNEQIQKQRLSEDRHKLHTTKSYLAKVFIKENLEKHIAELQLNEFTKANTAAADAQTIPGQGGTSSAGFGAGKKKKKGIPQAGGKENKEHVTEKHQVTKKSDSYSFDPKGMVALRMLVGATDMAKARRAMEMAKNGRSVPAVFMKSFVPLIDVLDDIMRSGMANVQMLKNLDKRAKRGLGIEESVEQVSDKLRGLYESQEDQAELLLASKDVVDRVQKAVDDLSKLRNEDLPPLLDAMRDEVGAEISSAYANIAIPTLDQLVIANGTARETLSQASRILTGEEQAPQAMGAEEIPVEAGTVETAPLPAEEFATADVAVGEEEVGRAER
jgi:hypothetical protein